MYTYRRPSSVVHTGQHIFSQCGLTSSHSSPTTCVELKYKKKLLICLYVIMCVMPIDSQSAEVVSRKVDTSYWSSQIITHTVRDFWATSSFWNYSLVDTNYHTHTTVLCVYVQGSLCMCVFVLDCCFAHGKCQLAAHFFLPDTRLEDNKA